MKLKYLSNFPYLPFYFANGSRGLSSVARPQAVLRLQDAIMGVDNSIYYNNLECPTKWSCKQQKSELFQEQLGQTLAENPPNVRVNW